jgi:hypothetical protein
LQPNPNQPGASFDNVVSGATVGLVNLETLTAQQLDLLYRPFNEVLPLSSVTLGVTN